MLLICLSNAFAITASFPAAFAAGAAETSGASGRLYARKASATTTTAGSRNFLRVAPIVRQLCARDRDDLDFLRLQVQDRARALTVQPAARLSGIDQKRFSHGADVLSVSRPVQDELVCLDGAAVDLAELVHQHDPVTANLEAVRRF